jgi:urea transport system substrate-binding protein
MTITRRKLLSSCGAAFGGLALGSLLGRTVVAADTIKIASIHDLTGGLGIYGKLMADLLVMGVEETNKSGGLLGKQVELITYDPQSTTQLYAQFAQQASVKDKVAVVHGGITSASREVIRPVLKRFNTLYFYNTQYEGGVCDRNIFCTGVTPAQSVSKLVPYGMKTWGKKVYIIAADYNYGQITASWVKKFTLEGGGQIVAADFFPLDVTDFGTTISKIQAAKPDFIFSVLVGANHNNFYRQWAAAGMKKEIPITATTFGIGNEHTTMAPEETVGIVAAFHYFQELDNPANKAFLERYYAKYGKDAPYVNELAHTTYLGWRLYAEGVKKAGSIDRMKVIEALESGISVQDESGTVAIDPATHHCILDVHVAAGTGHGFKVLESFSQQQPADTAAVCNLTKNPNDNQQYIIKM